MGENREEDVCVEDGKDIIVGERRRKKGRKKCYNVNN